MVTHKETPGGDFSQGKPAITKDNWQEINAKLQSKEIEVGTYTPTEIFELSRFAGKNGQHDLKVEIMELVLQHAACSPSDNLRVTIAQADLDRRHEKVQEARQKLDDLKEKCEQTSDSQVMIDWKQAMAEVEYRAGNSTLSSELRYAIIADSKKVEPPDITCYRIEGAIGDLILAVYKKEVSVADIGTKFEQALKEYHELLEKILDTNSKIRPQIALYRAEGEYYELKDDFARSLEKYLACFDVAQDVQKVFTAIEIVAMTNQQSLSHPRVQEIIDYLKNNIEIIKQSQYQTYIAALNQMDDKYDRVISVISK